MEVLQLEHLPFRLNCDLFFISLQQGHFLVLAVTGSAFWFFWEGNTLIFWLEMIWDFLPSLTTGRTKVAINFANLFIDSICSEIGGNGAKQFSTDTGWNSLNWNSSNKVQQLAADYDNLWTQRTNLVVR